MKIKKVIPSLFLMLFFTVLVTSANYAQKHSDCSSDATFKIVKFKTSASTDSYKKTVESELQAVAGVEKADLYLKDNIISISYKSELVTSAALMKVIIDKGFTAEMVQSNKTKSSCCSKDNSKKSCCTE